MPVIDYDLFQRKVLEALVSKPAPLTGSQIKFIRLYHRLTLQVFASLLKVSHPAVLKWENRGDDPSNMSHASEILLRLFVLHKLGTRNTQFVRTFQSLMERLGEDGADADESGVIRVSGVSPGIGQSRSRHAAG